MDVAGTTDMRSDVKAGLEGLLASGEFGVVDAADGYVLLARGAAAFAAELPDALSTARVLSRRHNTRWMLGSAASSGW